MAHRTRLPARCMARLTPRRTTAAVPAYIDHVESTQVTGLGFNAAGAIISEGASARLTGAEDRALRRGEIAATVPPVRGETAPPVANRGADHRDDHLRLRHAGARHDDRQCLPAAHPGQHVGVAGPDLVGIDVLHRRLGDHDAADRLARRPLWRQIHFSRLGHRVHLRLGACAAPRRASRSSCSTACCRACAAPGWCRSAKRRCSRSIRASGMARRWRSSAPGR